MCTASPGYSTANVGKLFLLYELREENMKYGKMVYGFFVSKSEL
jgi:hypothetical protein